MKYLVSLLLAFMGFSYTFGNTNHNFAYLYQGNVLAYGFVEDKNSTYVKVIGAGKDLSSVLVIPSEVVVNSRRYPVKAIGYAAFEDRDALIKVELPESITTIEESAFAGCENLKSIKFHNWLNNIIAVR